MNYFYFIYYLPYFIYVLLAFLIKKAWKRQRIKKNEAVLELVSLYFKNKKYRKFCLVVWILFVYLLLK